MAAYNKFNSWSAAPYNGSANLNTDVLKVLLTNTAPVATNSLYSDISATELANGNGYATGGATVTKVSSSQAAGTYKWVGSCANPTWTFTGAATFRYAVIYDSTTGQLIGYWDYGSSLVAASGDVFFVNLDATNGVFQNA